MAVDKDKFKNYLVFQARLQGRRIGTVLKAHEPDVVTAAIVGSVIQVLRRGAAAKPLSAKDIDLFYAEFLNAAGVEEYDLPMGGTAYRRGESAV